MAKKTLIIFIDALGYDLLKKTSFPPDLLNRTVKLIPNYGFGEAAVMWTGELPEKTNRWTEFQYNPKFSPFRWTRFFPLGIFDILREKFSFKPLKYFDFGLRKVIELITTGSLSESFPSTYQIPLSKLRYFLPVHDWQTYQFNSLNGYPTLFGILKERGIKYQYIGYPKVKTDYEVYKKSREAIKECEVVISFFSELDSIEHWHGKESIKVSKKINELSKFINDLINLFKKNNPKGSLIIFSDHGMSKVEKTIDLMTQIRKIGLKEGIDYLAFYDATLVRLWFFDQKSKRKIIEKLSTIKEGRIFQDNERKEAGLKFKNRAFGDIIFVVNPGIMISPNYFQGKKIFNSVHGHCPPPPEEFAFFTTDQGIKLGAMMRIKDLFNVILNIINI